MTVAIDRLNEVTRTAEVLTDNFCPVVLLRPDSKIPLSITEDIHPFGRIAHITHAETAGVTVQMWAEHLGAVPGLGVFLGGDKGSPVVAVDLDSEDAITIAKSLGVTSTGRTWVQKTATSGRYHGFYSNPGVDLKRKVGAASGLDLLSNGYACVAPTIAKGHDGVLRQYEWVIGHSPWDIPIADLEPLPEALKDWWLDLDTTPVTRGPSAGVVSNMTPGGDWFAQVLATPIPSGERNERLASIFGKLHRLFPLSVAVVMLHEVNRRCCVPPLPERELGTIVSSIGRRAGFAGREVIPL